MIRLYGHLRGGGSFAQVTAGMEAALYAHDKLAGFVSIDVEDGDDEPRGYDAPVSLNVGAPMGLVAAHRQGSHKAHWLLLAPNGEVLPPGLVSALTEPSAALPKGVLDGGLLAPSAWGAEVLRRSFPPDTKILVARHGVEDVFRPSPFQREAVRREHRYEEKFTVLHMSSGESRRKGTVELIHAWRFARPRLPPRARLIITMAMAEVTNVLWETGGRNFSEEQIDIYPAFTLSTKETVSLYGSMHLLCQPSRAEGFGLCPLEARCSGVPVAATTTTGFSEHMPGPGVVKIESGPVSSLGDFPGSLAPSVQPEAIAAALVAAYESWPTLDEEAMGHAQELRREWTWARGSADAIRQMTEET